MCLVEITSSVKPVISCASNLGMNLEIFTETSFVKRSRENILEFLLINHPLDCPICDQAGECDLQDQSLFYGSDRGRFKEMKRSVNDKEFGPIIKTIMTRCIHCTRCIRFAEEIAGLDDLGALGRGVETEIKMVISKFFDSEISGNVVDLCPVGALTSKPYAFTARPWELKSIESIDVLDSLNSNIRVDVKGNRVFRILPEKNENINEDWISDLIRFSYESLQSFRLKFPYLFLSNLFFFDFFFEYQFFFNWIFNFKIRLSWNQCFFFLNYLFFNSFIKFNIFYFFLGNGIGLTHSFFFYHLFKHLKNSYFFFENYLNRSIDERKSYLIPSFDDLSKNNIFLIYFLNFKESFSVFNARLKRMFFNTFYKKYVLYIGENCKSTFSFFHLGFSHFLLYYLIRGKVLQNNFFFKLKKNYFNLWGFSNADDFSDYLSFINFFDSINGFNFSFSSNQMGYEELGIGNSWVSNSFINSQSQISSFFYFFKTNNFFLNHYSFSLYQGFFLPDLKKKGNFLFLPSSNFLESEDSYLNIFGDLQFTNQVLDPFEEEVKSDFFIFKKLIFICFSSFFKSNISYLISFDLLLNEMIFFYFNFFCFIFDSFPLFSNYNNIYSFYKNQKKLDLCFFPYFYRFSMNAFDNFFVRYSKTLNNFYLNKYKKENNFS